MRQVKYLKDQFRLKNETNIESLLINSKEVIFEPNTAYSLRISLDFLQTDEAFESIQKVANRIKTIPNPKLPFAGTIAEEYLETYLEEEVQINLDEVKNSFRASGNHLFDFILHYNFSRDISWEEKVTIYCQMVSQYEAEFTITDQFSRQQQIEFALVYPK